MVIAIVIAPLLALSVWYTANQFDLGWTYGNALLAVVVLKAMALYLFPARSFTFEYVEKETEETDDK